MNASTQLDPGEDRLLEIENWLAEINETQLRISTLRSASSDASFRRYFRVLGADGTSYVVMVAPPGVEDCGLYLKVAKLLAAQRVRVPHVVACEERRPTSS